MTDITPTILDLTGVAHPQPRYGGRLVEPMIGRSLAPLVNGDVDRIYTDDDAVGYELAGHSVLFLGDYKIVLNRGSLGDNQWHLFNIVTDPGESRDLSSLEPVLLQRMLGLYHQYEQDNDVQPTPAGFDGPRQVALNGLHDKFRTQILVVIFTLLILLPFYVIYRMNRQP